MSGITFKAFLDCLPHVTAVGKPVLMRSRHGVGKSSLVYQFGINEAFPVVERRASQMTEGDLMGLPVVDGEVTVWNPPDWFKQCCTERCILFIDEIDRATPEVRQGFFELTDSRKLNGHTLHPDTLVFAAVNGGESSSQYQVGEMDPAELDRWTVFDLEPDIKDWINWGKTSGEIPSIILEFISEYPDHLENSKEDFEPNKVYPSRRSWHRLAQCLVEGDLLQLGQAQSPVVVNLVKAFVGAEAMMAFCPYVKNYEKEVSPEDILIDGKLDLVKDFELTAHIALIEKMNAKKYFDDPDKYNDKFFENLGKYFCAAPSEAAAKLQDMLGGTGGINGYVVKMIRAVPACKEKIITLFSDIDENE